MNKKLLTTAVGAALSLAAASASAIEAKVSGQINRAVMLADDGTHSEIHHVDNNNSGTRFRFTGSDQIMPGVKAGLVWEMGYQSNSAGSVTQTSRSTSPSLDERHAHVYFEGTFGTVSLGQGQGAADGGTEMDLSGTSLVNWAGVNFVGGAIVFRTSAGAAGPTISATSSSQDFESRYDRLRYDSPTLAGFNLSASSGTTGSGNNAEEIALWYSSDLGGAGKLAAAVGASKEDTTDISFDNETKGGSVSWLAPMGLNVTLSVSDQKIGTSSTSRTGKFKYVKVGYKTGAHAVAVDFGKADDQAAVDDEAEVMGIGYVFDAGKGVELYAGAKVHSLDRPGTEYEDIQLVTVGSRIKF